MASIASAAQSAQRRTRHISSSSLTGLSCLLFVLIADWLFYQHPIGWTTALFGLALLTLVIARSRRAFKHWSGWVVSTAFMLVLIACIEEPGWLEISLASLGLITLAFLSRQRWTRRAETWFKRWTIFLIKLWWQLPADLGLMHKWDRTHGGGGAFPVRIAHRWTLPIVLSLLFLSLFTIANPVISKWFIELTESVWSVVLDFFKYGWFGRVMLWLLVGVLVWSLQRVRVRDARRQRPYESLIQAPFAPPVVTNPLIRTTIDSRAMIVRCLVLFNLLFASYIIMDVLFLWAGAELPVGMTYGEYARRGAYPLVITALLAAAFVLVSFRAGESVGEMRWARLLVSIWIAQNVLLTFAAAWRLVMYVDFFSLTRLRVAAGIWMIIVALGLITIIWRILRNRSNSWLIGTNTTAAFVVMLICCFMNFDGLIARYNVRQCREIRGTGAKLDVKYLQHLGPESIPSLRWIVVQMPGHEVAHRAGAAAERLNDELNLQLTDWRGWTWRRARLMQDATVMSAQAGIQQSAALARYVDREAGFRPPGE